MTGGTAIAAHQGLLNASEKLTPHNGLFFGGIADVTLEGTVRVFGARQIDHT